MNPASMCPAHRLWPLVRRTIPPGESISPNCKRRHINRIIKKFPEKAGIPAANRSASNCFRLGISNSMLESMSTLGGIMINAGRNAAGYRPYRRLRNNEGGFADSLIRALDTPSIDEEPTIREEIYRAICFSGWFRQAGGKSMLKPIECIRDSRLSI